MRAKNLLSGLTAFGWLNSVEFHWRKTDFLLVWLINFSCPVAFGEMVENDEENRPDKSRNASCPREEQERCVTSFLATSK